MFNIVDVSATFLLVEGRALSLEKQSETAETVDIPRHTWVFAFILRTSNLMA